MSSESLTVMPPLQPQRWSTQLRPIAPALSGLDTAQNESNQILDNAALEDNTILNDSPLTKGGPHQRIKRKEQNRAAQRAFRERKERYVRELETRIEALEADHAQTVERLTRENDQLRNTITTMEREIYTLRHPTLPNDMIMRLDSQPMDTKMDSVPVTSPNTYPSPLTTDDAGRSPPRKSSTSSTVECIRDKDGISFCERLKDEVCSSAYDQLLSEPLFDSTGHINENVGEHPVPILTEKLKIFDEFAKSLSSDSTVSDATSDSDVVYMTCTQIWNRLSVHPRFEKVNVESLCHVLRTKAVCSKEGPLIEKKEVDSIICMMDNMLL